MNAALRTRLVPRLNSVFLMGQGRVASLGHRFRNGGELDWLTMFYIIAALAAAVVVVGVVSRHLRLKESGSYHSHAGLFRELCRAHRLGWFDRRLLVALARRQGVVIPARLFVEPERFEPARLQGMRETAKRRAARLSETLFRAESASGGNAS